MPPKPRAASPARRPRPQRPRPTPKWLLKADDLDAIAKTRALMVLSVLSGEKPVTAAIEELSISRGFYYQLETRALNAMLAALTPGSDADPHTDASGATKRIALLEQKVERLEQARRRAEHLLFLTRKLIKPAQAKTAAGRPAKPKTTASTSVGRRPSRGSATKPTTTAKPEPASTPTPAGATAAP